MRPNLLCTVFADDCFKYHPASSCSVGYLFNDTAVTSVLRLQPEEFLFLFLFFFCFLGGVVFVQVGDSESETSY